MGTRMLLSAPHSIALTSILNRYCALTNYLIMLALIDVHALAKGQYLSEQRPKNYDKIQCLCVMLMCK